MKRVIANLLPSYGKQALELGARAMASSDLMFFPSAISGMDIHRPASQAQQTRFNSSKPLDPRVDYPYTSLDLAMFNRPNPNFAPPPRPRQLPKPISPEEAHREVSEIMRRNSVPSSTEISSGDAAPSTSSDAGVSEYPVRVTAFYLGLQLSPSKFASDNAHHVLASGKDYHILLLRKKGDDLNVVNKGFNGVVAMFSFGSVAFFNTLPEVEEETCRQLARSYVSKPLMERNSEDATVILKPDLGSWFSKEPDRTLFSDLDNGNIELLGRVLGQSVALSHYHRIVDGYLKDFGSVLAEVAAGSKKSSMVEFSSPLRSAGLMHTLCSSSVTYTEVISKLGLLDPSTTAWKSDKYDEVWTRLRKDYELEGRLDYLSIKLSPIQDVAKFILEVRRDRSASFHEKIIIFLIIMEIVIALAEHPHLVFALLERIGLM